MSEAAFILGACMFGWILPELVFLHSARTDVRRVPMAINFFCGCAFALLAYGVRA